MEETKMKSDAELRAIKIDNELMEDDLYEVKKFWDKKNSYSLPFEEDATNRHKVKVYVKSLLLVNGIVYELKT